MPLILVRPPRLGQHCGRVALRRGIVVGVDVLRRQERHDRPRHGARIAGAQGLKTAARERQVVLPVRHPAAAGLGGDRRRAGLDARRRRRAVGEAGTERERRAALADGEARAGHRRQRTVLKAHPQRVALVDEARLGDVGRIRRRVVRHVVRLGPRPAALGQREALQQARRHDVVGDEQWRDVATGFQTKRSVRGRAAAARWDAPSADSVHYGSHGLTVSSN